MKKFILAASLMVSVMMSAQQAPKHEVVGDLVKSTYFHDNGAVSQQGYYKNGKVHGQWVSFDDQGNKTAIGEYQNGVKAGKWFFWNDNKLSEVDYNNSRIAAIKTWKEDAVASASK